MDPQEGFFPVWLKHGTQRTDLIGILIGKRIAYRLPVYMVQSRLIGRVRVGVKFLGA